MMRFPFITVTPETIAPPAPTPEQVRVGVRLREYLGEAQSTLEVAGRVHPSARINRDWPAVAAVQALVNLGAETADALPFDAVAAADVRERLVGAVETLRAEIRDRAQPQPVALASGMNDPDAWLQTLIYPADVRRFFQQEAAKGGGVEDVLTRVRDRLLGGTSGEAHQAMAQSLLRNRPAARALAERVINERLEKAGLRVFTLGVVALTDSDGRAALEQRLSHALAGLSPLPDVEAKLTADGWQYSTRSRPLAEAFAAVAAK